MIAGAQHVYLMPRFWAALTARRPQWRAAHDAIYEAEMLLGIQPPTWGKLMMHPKQWRGIQ